MAVITLRQLKALLIPDIQLLLKRAVESVHLCAPGGFDTVAEDIIQYVTDEQQFMILGAEDGQFKAVVLGHFPQSNIFPYPTIMLIYNEGSRALSTEVRDHLMDYLVENGYTRLVCVNMSGYADQVWLRGMTPEGVTSRIVGSLAEFEV